MKTSAPLLIEALPAVLDGAPITILNLDERGALVEHSMRLDEQRPHLLWFRWEGEEIGIECTVAESVLQDLLSDQRQKVTYHARLLFSETADRKTLERALHQYRERLDSAREANLLGTPEQETPSATIARMGDAFRGHKVGYIACIYRDGKWHVHESKSPSQPLDGFTLAAYEDESQIRMLQLAYEEADIDGRNLIRRFAAASLESS